MHLPFYTLTTYASLMSRPYEDHDTSSRLDIWDFLDVLQADFVERFSHVDARKLGVYVSMNDHELGGTCEIGRQQCTLSDGLVAMKLGAPTLYTCPYFSRDEGTWEHIGIDIIMPKNTPIVSFSDWEVVRVKHRNGDPKNEWNAIVIKTTDSPNPYYLCYEHLERIDVDQWQVVSQWQTLWLCGSTGYSTQYHLHFQIDTHDAPFHPYRHRDATLMRSYTINPLPYLHSISPKRIFVDLPDGVDSIEYQQAFISLHRQWIFKGHNKHVYPDGLLQRYEMALLIDRILLMYQRYTGIAVQNEEYIEYEDTWTLTSTDPELNATLRRLQKYGVMKWYSRDGTLYFWPTQTLSGEQLLAILGRIFYGLQDAIDMHWRQHYLDRFVQNGLIAPTRSYIQTPIPRKEVALLLWRMLKMEGMM